MCYLNYFLGLSERRHLISSVICVWVFILLLCILIIGQGQQLIELKW